MCNFDEEKKNFTSIGSCQGAIFAALSVIILRVSIAVIMNVHRWRWPCDRESALFLRLRNETSSQSQRLQNETIEFCSNLSTCQFNGTF